jgi:molybdopterin/thiamine biosynthesis adenylyltransferase
MVFSGSGQVWAEESATESLQWSPISEIVILGVDGRRVLVPVNISSPKAGLPDPRDARTAVVIGDEAVATVRNLKVILIGLGGVGSAVARLLAGYVDYLDLVDPDIIEAHNAPRLHFYAAGDEGQPKVEVVRREILRAFPGSHVQTVQERFPSQNSLECFKRADFVFCCPDHNAVRYAVARDATRFMKPVIEVGCGGRRKDGKIVALGYHVRLQVPCEACLACNGLDLSQLEDPSTTEMKRRIGYLNDEGVVPGELMPLTTKAAADAVEIFFRYTTGYARSVPRNLYFDALHFRMLDATTAYEPQPDCTLCGSAAGNLKGAGDRLSDDQRILTSPGGDYAVA